MAAFPAPGGSGILAYTSDTDISNDVSHNSSKTDYNTATGGPKAMDPPQIVTRAAARGDVRPKSNSYSGRNLRTRSASRARKSAVPYVKPPTKSRGEVGESVESLQWSTTGQELVGDSQKAQKWSSSTQFGVTLVEPDDSVLPLIPAEQGHEDEEGAGPAELLGASSRPQSRATGTTVIDLHGDGFEDLQLVDDAITGVRNGRPVTTLRVNGASGSIRGPPSVEDLGSDLTHDQVSADRGGEGSEVGPLTVGRRVHLSPPRNTAPIVNDVVGNVGRDVRSHNPVPPEPQNVGGVKSVRTSVDPLRAVGGTQRPSPITITSVAPLNLNVPPPLDLWGNPLNRNNAVSTAGGGLSSGAIPKSSAQAAADLRIRREWSETVLRAMEEADDLVLPFKGKKMRPARATDVAKRAEKITEVLVKGAAHCEDRLQKKCADYRRQLSEVIVGLEDMSFEVSQEEIRRMDNAFNVGPSASSSPIRKHHRQQGRERERESSPPPASLDFARRSVEFLLSLITDDQLPDVAPGSPMDANELRNVHDIKLQEVTRVVKELREATYGYSKMQTCDFNLILRAQRQGEVAYKWTREVIERYRLLQLHLSSNTPAKHKDFVCFDPAGDISIYEFFSSFEEWASGYIAEDAKAQELFNKYLPVTLTEGYEELRELRKSYSGMKAWMIRRYGMVKTVADMKIRAIQALKPPKSADDVLGQARHYREIHRIVAKLFGLELRKGVPVPGVQEYVQSNAFLVQLSELLPAKIREKWAIYLAIADEDEGQVQGLDHLNKILNLLKTNYRALEIQGRLTAIETKTRSKPVAKDSSSDSAPGSGPAAAAVQQPSSSNRTRKNSDRKRMNAWTCLMKGHDDHLLGQCTEFFSLSPEKRRQACRQQGCWTCLSRVGCERGECTRLKKLPTLLVCQECAEVGGIKKPPLHVLMCARKEHVKPKSELLEDALGKWAPKFSDTKRQGPVVVGLISTYATSTTKPPRCKTSAPTGAKPAVCYDTTTGSTRRISKADMIVRPSKEDCFYVMQWLRIGGEDVLTFFDSGANTHLVEGELAEKVGFTVLSDRCVPIGTVGGGEMWSEYGQYACILGPDCEGVLHELECQGISRISRPFPEFDLRPLHHDSMLAFHDGPQLCFPPSIGGDRVRLLLGVKSLGIAPRLQCVLPNGLGIFVSALTDVHGSNVCYGGTHWIFSQGYARAGVDSNHVQVMFSELARAYMRGPYVQLQMPGDTSGPTLNKKTEAVPVEFCDDSLESWFAAQDQKMQVPIQQVRDCDCLEVGNCANTVACNKAAIPLAKLKGLIDEEDIPAVGDVRCDKCMNCPACKLSNRVKTRSLQEAHEQDIIVKSVRISLEEKKVWVELPFVKKPTEFLSARHKGSDNLYQALRVYRAQCHKPPEVRNQIVAAQADLAARGFMVPLESLSIEKQKLINEAEFRHFFPWRAVYKPGSVSTPVRIVVDPSCTGLNIILAKGENMLSRIPDVLVRLRTKRAAWTTDVSKLYNMLHLTDQALPYSLFLFDPSLNAANAPKVWVMQRAWYGVTSTGNQSGVALEELASLLSESHPRAQQPLTADRYVDDIASGADSVEERELQIEETRSCLAAGGFSLKFVAKSGHLPPDGSSSDGKTVSCLGMAWETREELLGPMLAPMNLQRKVRGQKAAPERDVTTREGLASAFADGLITKSAVLSRMAEFYDPAGWWEPLRLQLKLLFHELVSLDWNDPVPDEFQKDWIEAFLVMEKSRALRIPRCVVPESADPNWRVRLICLADAAEGAGGCAIYGGVELPDGTYSCRLLLAKSRLMKQSVPRNELEAILLMSDAALEVAHSLGDRVGEVLFYTDSAVALCWVLNTRKRLRMFVHNRVRSIRHAIKQVINGEEHLPLFHIDGQSNLADRLTKPESLRQLDIGIDSLWQNGLDWMRLPTSVLPRSQEALSPSPDTDDLVRQEIFEDVELHTAQVEAREMLQEEFPVPTCVDVFTVTKSDLPRSYRRSLNNAMYGNGGNFTLEGGSPRASSGEVRTVRVLSQEEETRIREEDWEPPVPANRIPVVTGISRNTRRRRAMLDYDSSSH